MSKNSNYYFGSETEEAIKRYNRKSTRKKEKEILFNGIIYPSFQKLVGNLINVYKMQYIDDKYKSLRDECISHLVSILDNFDPTKNSRAFSYFNVVAKNYLIACVIQFKKRTHDIDLDINHANNHYDNNRFFYEIYNNLNIEEDQLPEEFFKNFVSELKKWQKKILDNCSEEKFLAAGTKKHQRSLYKVISAIIYLFENASLFQVFSKKGVYIYIQELTGLKSGQTLSSIKRIKKFYDRYRKSYFQKID